MKIFFYNYFKSYLYLLNTSLIYKNTLHIILENKSICKIILVCMTDKISIFKPVHVKGLHLFGHILMQNIF